MPTDPRRAASLLGAVHEYASRLRRPASSPAHVLIVDDEEPVRKFVGRVLGEAGYDTRMAASGVEAIEIAERMEGLDLLVTDVMMPEMLGDELARRLRQQQPSLKVLYLTAYSDRLFKEKVMLWADEAFLDKPCSVKSIREAVSLLLYGRFEPTPDAA
jgi:two-component system cell cycle sensor histidine kinase/response regulator CckA